jgi:hypothetical protein
LGRRGSTVPGLISRSKKHQRHKSQRVSREFNTVGVYCSRARYLGPACSVAPVQMPGCRQCRVGSGNRKSAKQSQFQFWSGYQFDSVIIDKKALVINNNDMILYLVSHGQARLPESSRCQGSQTDLKIDRFGRCACHWRGISAGLAHFMTLYEGFSPPVSAHAQSTNWFRRALRADLHMGYSAGIVNIHNSPHIWLR